MDIDPAVRPHILADAWLPPFGKDTFDVVILDPPYVALNQQMKSALLRAAAHIARDRVFWFHTMWVAADTALSRRRSWLIRVGDSCACRCLLEFKVKRDHPRRPVQFFTRGPAIKYNRWLAGNVGLPFDRGLSDHPPGTGRGKPS